MLYSCISSGTVPEPASNFVQAAPMLIDFHCHILPPDFGSRHRELVSRDITYATLFPNPGARMSSAEALVTAMADSGVDHSVVLGFGWTDREIAREVNDYIIESAVRYGESMTGFCSVNPAWGRWALAEMERCAAAGLKGVGELHPDSQGFDLTDSAALAPFMALAGDLGFPVLIHTSEPVGHLYPGKGTTTPDKVYKFIRSFPENTIICAHWGGGLAFYGLMPELREELRNVYFDTAASPLLYRSSVFSVAATTIGADRILYGSDYPLLSQNRVIRQARQTDLDNDSLAAILGGNAASLLGLPEISTPADAGTGPV